MLDQLNATLPPSSEGFCPSSESPRHNIKPSSPLHFLGSRANKSLESFGNTDLDTSMNPHWTAVEHVQSPIRAEDTVDHQKNSAQEPDNESHHDNRLRYIVDSCQLCYGLVWVDSNAKLQIAISTTESDLSQDNGPATASPNGQAARNGASASQPSHGSLSCDGQSCCSFCHCGQDRQIGYWDRRCALSHHDGSTNSRNKADSTLISESGFLDFYPDAGCMLCHEKEVSNVQIKADCAMSMCCRPVTAGLALSDSALGSCGEEDDSLSESDQTPGTLFEMLQKPREEDLRAGEYGTGRTVKLGGHNQ